MNRDLQIAIHFKEFEGQNGLDFPVYTAEGVLIGKLSEDERYFTEYFTGIKYLNLDIANANEVNEGFRFVVRIKDLKSASLFKGVDNVYKSFWKDKEDKIYFYSYNDKDEADFVYMEVDEFNNRLGTNLVVNTTEEINEMIDLLLDGDKEKVESYFEKHPEYLELIPNGQETKEYKIDKPISETISEIKKYIIAQDEAIKKIVIAIYKNITFDNPSMKSNILMYGPTGSGKTAIINTLAKVFDLPVWIEDMTRFTETGYKGADIDDILVNLYNNAEGNLARAERSILFLDEIDKKASNDGDKSFNKGDVLKSLLKIVEGGKFEVSINSYETVMFDTSKLTVIVGGAFTELYKKREAKKDTIVRGFGLTEEKEIQSSNKEITIKDFEKHGMPIEFLGRFKTIVRLNELTLDDMITILKDSDLSALKNYKKVLKKEGIELVIPEEIYIKIAEKAYEYHTGARSLNIVVDRIFEPILYEYFEDKNNVEVVELNGNLSEDKSGFKLTKKQQQLTIDGFEI